MIYLLDVNVLLAMRYATHVHHDRTMHWLNQLEGHGVRPTFATCSITELGFIRVAGNRNTDLAKSVTAARQDLSRLNDRWSLNFVSDPLGAAHLPAWVKQPPHVTDGHLLALATSIGGRLVTLDSKIPGALFIPKLSDGPMMVREPAMPYRVERQDASHVS